MFGFVLKDFFVMRKNILYYAGFLIIYGILSATGLMPYGILAGMVAMMGLVLPMSSFAFDDQAKWDKFAVSTPAGRRGIVRGKYFFALFCTFCAAVLVGIILTALAVLGTVDVEVWWEPLAVVGACCCSTLLLDSLCLPLLLKFGAEKTRLMGILIFLLVFGVMALMGYFVDSGLEFPAVSPLAATLIPFLLAAVTIVCLVVSYAAAQNIYGKKEL